MQNKGKIITVFPVIAGNGAKYIATNIADSIKKEDIKKKVVLVDLNLKHPYLASAMSEFDEIHGIDNIIDKIDGNLLNFELFKENIITLKNNVDLLKGTKMIGKHKMFSVEHITKILEYLTDFYDYVIISVASEADNAATVCAINEADSIYMVVRNNISNLKRLDYSINMINAYKSLDSDIKIIYNQFSAASKVDIGKVISDYNISVLGIVEYDESTIDNINLNNSKGFFKPKNKNNELYIKIAKDIKGKGERHE